MGAASSRLDHNATRSLDKVETTGVLAGYINRQEATQLSLGKHASCLDKYNVTDLQSRKAVFSVQSDLSAAKGRVKTTELFDAVGESTSRSILSVSTLGEKTWQINTGTTKVASCRVKRTNSGRTSMSITFNDVVDNEGGQVMWLLVGDKVRSIIVRAAFYSQLKLMVKKRQSVVVTTSSSDDTCIARLERKSRNIGKKFTNPHAYNLTIASGVDVAFLVAICICLDKYENRSREKSYRREFQKRGPTNIQTGGMSGSMDVGGFGSACF